MGLPIYFLSHALAFASMTYHGDGNVDKYIFKCTVLFKGRRGGAAKIIPNRKQQGRNPSLLEIG